ncbi:MAG: hypothetical protein HP496_18265 [Nitrospira sp.]|nr:hypothetical protein [Nitrospira sp.]
MSVDSAYQSPARNQVYFDPTTIRRDEALVTLWQLTDYKVDARERAVWTVHDGSPPVFLDEDAQGI